jgi:hypothetical protein
VAEMTEQQMICPKWKECNPCIYPDHQAPHEKCCGCKEGGLHGSSQCPACIPVPESQSENYTDEALLEWSRKQNEKYGRHTTSIQSRQSQIEERAKLLCEKERSQYYFSGDKTRLATFKDYMDEAQADVEWFESHMSHPSLDEVEKRLRDIFKNTSSEIDDFSMHCNCPDCREAKTKLTDSILSLLKDYQPKEIKYPDIMTGDQIKRLVHDAMTQYSADQYLKGEKIDQIKQCEFVGIFIAVIIEQVVKKACQKAVSEAKKGEEVGNNNQ